MSSDPNNETTNTVHDPVDSNIVQAGSVGTLWVGSDKRTVLLLALTLVVVVVAAAVIVWLVRDEPEPVGDPLAADTSAGLDCSPDSGWVVPDPGPDPQPIAYAHQGPPNAVLGSGAVVTTTLQGLSDPAVVLHSIRAEVLGRKPAVAGVLLPAYCESDVVPKTFSLDLSSASPTAVPMTTTHSGQQIEPKDFPFKVDPRDVEQFKIRVDSQTEDVEFVLWVRWSSGAKSGEFRIDDKGEPFRITASSRSTRWCTDPKPQQLVWRPSCA